MIILFVCLVFAMTVLVAGACAKKEEPAKPPKKRRRLRKLRQENPRFRTSLTF